MTIKDFELEKWESDCLKTKMPKAYVPVDKFTDKTANGLTKLIISFISLRGWQAERISTTGRYIEGKSVSRGFYGNVNLKGKYIPGQSTPGSADISATIKGLSVKIEVKMKDKQSVDQKKYQNAIEQAGGKYWLVHNWNEFYMLYVTL